MTNKPLVDREFRSLISPLSSEERNALEASIKIEGCRDPLVVWSESNVLLDGHNRLEICESKGIPYSITHKSLADRLAAKIWIRQNQSARRNLTDDQRAMNAAALAGLLSEQAKIERAKKAAETRWEDPKKCLENAPYTKHWEEPKPKEERSRQQAAKSSGVSERKVRQAQTVRKASPELAQKVECGEVSLAAAVREIKRAEIVDRLESIESKNVKEINGVYDVVVIDPPWPIKKIERDERPNQSELDYPVMTEEEISSLDIPTCDDCHVWVWTTHRFLPLTIQLLDGWGLKYVCTFVWHKNGGFQPVGLPQYNCEFAVYARKGSPHFIDTKAFNVCFNGGRGAHSEKPEEFYAMVRRVTAGRRLDMFGRRSIEGFDSWGNEA